MGHRPTLKKIHAPWAIAVTSEHRRDFRLARYLRVKWIGHCVDGKGREGSAQETRAAFLEKHVHRSDETKKPLENSKANTHTHTHKGVHTRTSAMFPTDAIDMPDLSAAAAAFLTAAVLTPSRAAAALAGSVPTEAASARARSAYRGFSILRARLTLADAIAELISESDALSRPWCFGDGAGRANRFIKERRIVRECHSSAGIPVPVTTAVHSERASSKISPKT